MREHGSFPLRKRTPAVPGHEELCHPRTKLYFRCPPYRGIPIFSQSHGPALLKGFVDEYSDIEISLTTDTSDRLVKLVKKKTSILLSSAATRNGPNPIFFWKMPRCTWFQPSLLISVHWHSSLPYATAAIRLWMNCVPAGGARTSQSPPLLTDCKRLQYLRGNRQPRSWPLTDSGRHASQVQTECRPTDDLQQPEAAYISSEPPHIQRSHAPVYTGTDFCWLCKNILRLKITEWNS